jgi:putative protease
VDNGADSVSLQLVTEEAYRSNFNKDHIGPALRYARDRGCRTVVSLDTPQTSTTTWRDWRELIDVAAQEGAHALEARTSVPLLYGSAHYSALGLHYIVEDNALDHASLKLLTQRYGIEQIILPRVLSLTQLDVLARERDLALQVSGFGRQCALVDSSTRPAGQSDHIVSKVASDTSVEACAAPERAVNDSQFGQQHLPSTAILRLLPQLWSLGIQSLSVETEGGNPACQAAVTRVWREALDTCLRDPSHYTVKSAWIFTLNQLSRRFHCT